MRCPYNNWSVSATWLDVCFSVSPTFHESGQQLFPSQTGSHKREKCKSFSLLQTYICPRVWWFEGFSLVFVSTFVQELLPSWFPTFLCSSKLSEKLQKCASLYFTSTWARKKVKFSFSKYEWLARVFLYVSSKLTYIPSCEQGKDVSLMELNTENCIYFLLLLSASEHK